MYTSNITLFILILGYTWEYLGNYLLCTQELFLAVHQDNMEC